MRELFLSLSAIVLILLLCLCFYLPEDKKMTTQVVTVVNNETLLSKSVKSVSCDDSVCNEYYAKFANHSELINKDTYNKIKEGEKVTLTVINKNPNWLSWLLIVSIFILFFIIAIGLTIENNHQGGGEYYG